MFRFSLFSHVPPSNQQLNMDYEFNWRDQGVVPPVRDDHTFSFCWAYASVAACEAIHHIAYKPVKFKLLSVQHLIDCYDQYKPDSVWGHACQALVFIRNNGGFLYAEEDYPHMEKDERQPCAIQGIVPATKIHAVGMVRRNEKKLLEIVKLQPVVGMISSSTLFSAGMAGNTIIRFKKDEPRGKPDHFVLIVGYGREDGVDYWICQNCWGVDFRDDGYFKIERNVDDECGTANIARKCYFPIIRGHGVGVDIEESQEAKYEIVG